MIPDTYYDGAELYRQAGRAGHLPINQTSRFDSQYDMVDAIGSRTSPPTESEGKSAPPRRRIAVACGRCRKRKIKCSGDDGSGEGCSNCKSAGNDNCHFLRVNSEECPPKHALGWPSINPAQPRLTGYQTYPVSRSSRFPPSSTSYIGTGPCSRILSGQEYYGGLPSYHASRPTYSSSYGTSFDEESPGVYGVQSVPYMLPSPDANSIPSYYGSPESTRSWNPLVQSDRGAQNVLFPEHEMPNPMVQSNFPYPSSTSPQNSMSSDIPSLFPAMNSLSSNLPAQDRILPNPASARSQSVSGSNGHVSDGLPYVTYNYRSSNPWGPEQSIFNGSQNLSRTLSNGSINNGDSSISRLASTTAQDIGFGYIPISHSPSNASVNANATYSSNDSADTPSDYPASSGSSLEHNVPRDSHIPTDDTNAEVYGYSTSRHSGDGESQAGTLMTGQQYTQLPHPSVQSPFESSHPGSADVRARLAPRPSASSLNASHAY